MEMTLGELIQLWRKRRGYTQWELATRADVSRNYISMLETGNFINPSLAQLEKIAYALGLSLEISFCPKEQSGDNIPHKE